MTTQRSLTKLACRVRVLASTVAVAMALILIEPVVAAADEQRIDTAAIDAYVAAYMERNSIPGAAVAVTRGDHVVHMAGYGKTSGGNEVTPNTRFPVASVSKSFTAAAVLLLVERGKVELDDPVVEYLPGFTMADPRVDQITVRNLLNQTSGLDDRRVPDRSVAQSLRERVAQLNDADLLFAPGKRFRYDNLNYQVAARLVEVVSGRPFATFMTDEVFPPLGMNSTTTVDTTAEYPRAGHIRLYGWSIPAPASAAFINGSHGLITTASDLTGWLIAHNNGGVAPNGDRLLSRPLMRLAHGSTQGGRDYVMGWNADEPGKLSHSGGHDTYMAEVTLLLDEGYGIAVMVNVGMTLVAADAAAITEGIEAILHGKQPQLGWPPALVADLILAGLTLTSVALGTLGLARASRWARTRSRRPLWRTSLRLLPYLLPTALLLSLPSLVELIYTRSVDWNRVVYAAAALVIWLGVTALAGLAVTVVLFLGRKSLRHVDAEEEAKGIGADEEPAPANVRTC